VVEAEGVRRARGAASEADLRIGVLDLGSRETGEALVGLLGMHDIVAFNKADLVVDAELSPRMESWLGLAGYCVATSTRAEDGVVGLERMIHERVVRDLSGAEAPAATRLRHRDSLLDALANLERALADIAEPELAAENVRLAARALARVTGRVDPEDVLDRVFSSFCIGK
jgi:tRNA modification GTPase